MDAGLHEVGNVVDELQVVGRKEIPLLLAAGYFGAVEPPAGLRTQAAVRRLSAEIARKKAEPRFADAQRAVHEDLKLARGARLDVLHLGKAELPREHDPRYARAAHGVGCARARDVHLGGRMDAEPGKVGARHVEHAEILDDESVRPDLVEIGEEAEHAFRFAFLQYRIDGDKNLLAFFVEGIDGGFELRPGEIRGPETGIETLQSEINGIGPFVDSCVQCFRVACRSQ